MGGEEIIPVFIDGCAWNFLHENKIDLSKELPGTIFKIFITREVEIELEAIPLIGKNGEDKASLKNYIKKSIIDNGVATTSVFGFCSLDADGNPSEVQIYGGFDQGTFQSEADRAWYASASVRNFTMKPGKKKSGLSDNQGDASLAVRSFDAIVLTNEGEDKKGPLMLARESGGLVLYLHNLSSSAKSLREFIEDAWRKSDKKR